MSNIRSASSERQCKQDLPLKQWSYADLGGMLDQETFSSYCSYKRRHTGSFHFTKSLPSRHHSVRSNASSRSALELSQTTSSGVAADDINDDSSAADDTTDDLPSDVDLIEHGLYIGNLTAATNSSVLESLHVSHVLTVDSCPLSSRITSLPGLKTRFVQVTDTAKEDLLSSFEESSRFISDGIEKGAVLVHCYFGMSRSATLVIAYLMKKHQLSLEEAIQRVRNRRRVVAPNPGFIAQLKLYQNMAFTIDQNDLQYRMFRLQMAADRVKKAKLLPHGFMDVVKPDPGLASVRPEPVCYRCFRCRRVVAAASNILPHSPQEMPLWFDSKWSGYDPAGFSKQTTTTATTKATADAAAPTTTTTDDKQQQTTMKNGTTKPLAPTDAVKKPVICTQVVFIEPLAWMTPILHELQGKLHCPKCLSKLGSFSWIMGCLCPCGAKVAPAFYLVPSRVDRGNMVQNLQATV